MTTQIFLINSIWLEGKGEGGGGTKYARKISKTYLNNEIFIFASNTVKIKFSHTFFLCEVSIYINMYTSSFFKTGNSQTVEKAYLKKIYLTF